MIWYYLIWSIYSQRDDLLVRYFFQFQIFFKPSKMVNFIKPKYKTRKNLKEWKSHLFINLVTWVLLHSYWTLQNIIFYFEITSFYKQPKKIINQSFIPKYPINYQNKKLNCWEKNTQLWIKRHVLYQLKKKCNPFWQNQLF